MKYSALASASRSARAIAIAGLLRNTLPERVGLGLGWDLTVFGEDRILWHTGADRGEWTLAYVVPRTGEGLVILTSNAAGYRAVLPLLEQAGTHPRFLTYLKALAAAG